MESSEKTFSEKESLQLITEMISNAKQNFKDNGFFYLVWGWLVFVAALSHYVLLTVIHYDKPFLPWPILMSLGAVATMIYGMSQSRKAPVRTYMGKFMGFLWGGFSISLLIVLASMHKIGPEVAYPFILILYGIGTFVSGGMLRFPLLIAGGIVCWVLAVISFYVGFEHQLLLVALAVLLSYIIPGHVLKSNYKNV